MWKLFMQILNYLRKYVWRSCKLFAIEEKPHFLICLWVSMVVIWRLWRMGLLPWKVCIKHIFCLELLCTTNKLWSTILCTHTVVIHFPIFIFLISLEICIFPYLFYCCTIFRNIIFLLAPRILEAQCFCIIKDL